MKTRHIIAFLLCATLFGACSRPKVISDDDLQSVLKDIYLANQYADHTRLNTDSLDIYAPILKEYGYKPRDLRYTLEDFSKRKSLRITDIIDGTVALLDDELAYLSRRVAILDTIDLIAAERYKRLVYFDSLILATRIADTAKLRIVLPAERGAFDIRYAYTLDSLDKNENLRATYILRDSVGRQVGGNHAARLQGYERREAQTRIEVPESARKLEIRLGNYGKEMKRPHLRIDSLTVTHYLPREQALDSLQRALFRYIPTINGTKEYPYFPQDSGTLSLHAPWLPEERDFRD